jgi:hypothetical protein
MWTPTYPTSRWPGLRGEAACVSRADLRCDARKPRATAMIDMPHEIMLQPRLEARRARPIVESCRPSSKLRFAPAFAPTITTWLRRSWSPLCIALAVGVRSPPPCVDMRRTAPGTSFEPRRSSRLSIPLGRCCVRKRPGAAGAEPRRALPAYVQKDAHKMAGGYEEVRRGYPLAVGPLRSRAFSSPFCRDGAAGCGCCQIDQQEFAVTV